MGCWCWINQILVEGRVFFFFLPDTRAAILTFNCCRHFFALYLFDRTLGFRVIIAAGCRSCLSAHEWTQPSENCISSATSKQQQQLVRIIIMIFSFAAVIIVAAVGHLVQYKCKMIACTKQQLAPSPRSKAQLVSSKFVFNLVFAWPHISLMLSLEICLYSIYMKLRNVNLCIFRLLRLWSGRSGVFYCQLSPRPGACCARMHSCNIASLDVHIFRRCALFIYIRFLLDFVEILASWPSQLDRKSFEEE